MLELIRDELWKFCVAPIVIISGVYLTIKFKWVQLKLLPNALRLILTKNDSKTTDHKQHLSSFNALAAVLGGNLGTGNIAGVAVAMTTGGVGAIFWMAVIAFFGSVIKFSGCYLGVKYRQKDLDGNYIGGPMYYLSNGLNNKKIAVLYTIFGVLTVFTVGNLVQVNSIVLPLTAKGINPIVSGVSLALFVLLVLDGGMDRFKKVLSSIVPFMAALYIGIAIIIIFLHYDKLFTVFNLIIHSAFTNEAAIGGVAGFTVLQTITVGFARGIFATDTGIGLAPILHSQVASHECEEETAISQALVSIVAPFIVIVICIITALVLILTDNYTTITVGSTNLCIKAFSDGLNTPIAGIIVLATLALFAFTTILTWTHCGEKIVEFISPKLTLWFRYLFIAAIPIGAVLSVEFVWAIADIAVGLMLLTNLYGILRLHKLVFILSPKN